MQKDHRTAIIIFLLAAGLYLLTISPTVNWRDTPEFVNLSYTLGIAHPAGFPVYCLTAKLFSMLPIGSIAFRTNLFSHFFAVLSIILLYFLSLNILNSLSQSGAENRNRYASIIASILLLANFICWESALIAEVYSFNMFFTLLILFLAIKYSITNLDTYIYSAAFVYGVSSGNHATVAFFLPALIAFFFMVTKEKKIAKFILVCTFFMLGFSIYIYLPIRSLANPSYDWGNPEKFSQFIMHITDRKTSHTHFSGVKDYSSIIKNLHNYLISLNNNISILGIILAVLGGVLLFKKKKSTFILIFLILITNTIFFFDWNSGVQLPSYVGYLIFIAVGIGSVLECGEKKTLAGKSTTVSKFAIYPLLLIIIFMSVRNHEKLNASNIFTGEEEFKETFLKLPEKSMVIASYQYFHYKYYQDILGLRRDIALIGYGEILYPKLFSLIDSKKYNNIIRVEYDTEITNTAKITQFINRNFNNFDNIFTEIVSEFQGLEGFIKYHDALLFKFTGAKIEELSDDDLTRITDYFNKVIFKFIYEPDYRSDDEASFIYIQDLIDIIDYILHYGHVNKSLYMIDTMLKVFGDDFRGDLLKNDEINLKVLAGVAYIKKMDFERATDFFMEMIKNNERKFEAYNKLAFISKYKKDYETAIGYYKLAISENPYALENYLELGDIYEKLDKNEDAYEVYRSGIRHLFQDEKGMLMLRMQNLKSK